MSQSDVSNYVPYHRGLDINFYQPELDGRNLYHNKADRDKLDWVDITITCSSINPDPLHECIQRDIDEELALIDSKYGILKDHLTHTDNKKLIHNHQSKQSLLKHGTVLQHPYLQGENDYLKSKAEDVHKVTVPLSEVKEFENHLERRKAFYKSAKLEYIEKIDEKTNEKSAEFDFGYI